MPSIRIGFASDFTLKGSNIGIGTTTADVKLQVPGTLKGDLSITGVSTLAVYGGFAAQKQNVTKDSSIGFSTTGIGTFIQVDESETGFLSLVGEYNTVSEDIIVDDGKIFQVSTGSTVSVGTLESVSIQSHFSVPDGGINDRPDQPTEGMVRFNDDLNTLEFYNGIEWRQFTVTGASGRVAFAGGAAFPPGTTQYATIDFVNIQSLGNTSHFGELLTADSRVGGCASSTRGLFAGGFSPANNDDIDYITLSSEGNGIDFGNLTQARQTIAGCSSSTRGVWNGGRNPGAVDTIDYNEIATLGNALDFGDLTTNKREWPQAVSSPTRGVIASGEILTNLDTIIMSSKGNAVEYGDLTKARGAVGALGNSVRGVFAGGNPIVPTIDYITTASGGNATDFGNLTVARMAPFAGASATRGIFGQGYAFPLNSTAMDYITIASTGDAQDFGDASFRRIFSQGSASDSHGGLGGF